VRRKFVGYGWFDGKTVAVRDMAPWQYDVHWTDETTTEENDHEDVAKWLARQ
jgi:hypothetical protein